MSLLTPFLIGVAIDNLTVGSWRGFAILIIIEIIFLTLNTINKVIDTKLYTTILKKECVAYFESAVNRKAKDTTISARVNMVDDITGFFEVVIPNILSTIIGVLVPIIYISRESSFLITLSAITFSIVVLLVTFRWQSKLANNNALRKDEGEKEQYILLCRDKQKYFNYLTNIFKIDVDSSNTEAKSYFVSYIIQLGLLSLILFMAIQTGVTTGEMFAIVTYTYALNDEVTNLPLRYQEIKNSLDSAFRLE